MHAWFPCERRQVWAALEQEGESDLAAAAPIGCRSVAASSDGRVHDGVSGDSEVVPFLCSSPVEVLGGLRVRVSHKGGGGVQKAHRSVRKGEGGDVVHVAEGVQAVKGCRVGMEGSGWWGVCESGDGVAGQR